MKDGQHVAYVCGECRDKHATTREVLTLYIAPEHFSCDVCGKPETAEHVLWSGDLRAPLQTHRGGRPIDGGACNRCGGTPVKCGLTGYDISPPPSGTTGGTLVAVELCSPCWERCAGALKKEFLDGVGLGAAIAAASDGTR